MRIEIILDTHKIIITEDGIKEGIIRKLMNESEKAILKINDKNLLRKFAWQCLDLKIFNRWKRISEAKLIPYLSSKN